MNFKKYFDNSRGYQVWCKICGARFDSFEKQPIIDFIRHLNKHVSEYKEIHNDDIREPILDLMVKEANLDVEYKPPDLSHL